MGLFSITGGWWTGFLAVGVSGQSWAHTETLPVLSQSHPRALDTGFRGNMSGEHAQGQRVAAEAFRSHRRELTQDINHPSASGVAFKVVRME